MVDKHKTETNMKGIDVDGAERYTFAYIVSLILISHLSFIALSLFFIHLHETKQCSMQLVSTKEQILKFVQER